MHLLTWWTYDVIGGKNVEEEDEANVGIMNGVEDVDEINVVPDSD